jgi:hypothetical protein
MRLHVFKRFFRFRLSLALFVLTLLCAALGSWARRAHRQRVAIEQISEQGGSVFYRDEVSSKAPVLLPHSPPTTLDDFYRRPDIVNWRRGWYDPKLSNGAKPVAASPDSPARAIDLTPLAAISGIRELYLTGHKISPGSYPALAELTELRVLHLDYSTADDVLLEHITADDHLKELRLGKTRVTDSGVAYLVEFKNLKTLDLSGTDISDRAVHSLGKCTSLTFLGLDETRISPHAMADLKKILPNTQISWWPQSKLWRWDKKKRRFVEPQGIRPIPPLNSVL